MRFTGVFFSLRVTNRHDIAASLHRRFNTTKIASVNRRKNRLCKRALADVYDKYREIAPLSLARSF